MESVDLVIIGGGISGAGIAQCAAAAGFSVLLLERGEVAGQTSANSSKLIHGGLRYLETGQIPLVRSALAERRALLTLAPALVKPVPFYIPVYENSRRGPWTIRAGLSLYALLSELDPLGKFRSLPSVQWSAIKGLKLHGLKAIYQYWDAQTDDKLLTRAVIKSAKSLGAQVLEQASCTAIEHGPQACTVHYRFQETAQQVNALTVINAAGPWVNQVLESVSPPIRLEPIELVQGSHVLLDIPCLDGIVYLESCFDERVVFVMPWKGKTLVGTTEAPIESLSTTPEASIEEIDYLLGIYRHYFLTAGDMDKLHSLILKTFCGVRVLPKRAGSAFDKPRETLQKKLPSHPNLLTLYGGKLTTYRIASKEVVEWVEERIGGRTARADFDKLMLN